MTDTDDTLTPTPDTEQEPTTPPTEPQKAPATDFMKDPAILSYIAEQVKQGIQEALKGAVPKANTVDPSLQEKAAFEKMSYKDRVKLFQSNPDLYNKLAKGV